MFQQQFITYLLEENARKEAEIRRLNDTVFELIDKWVFKETPNRIAKEKAERANLTPIVEDIGPQDQLSLAEKAAEKEFLERGQ